MPGVRSRCASPTTSTSDPPRDPAPAQQCSTLPSTSGGVFFTLNHLFFFYRRQMPLEDYVGAMLRTFAAFEVQNGAMLREQNELIDALLSSRALTGCTRVGGSDAHTLRRIGTTYTEAEGRTRAEFLDSLRAGRTRVGGRHGSTKDLAMANLRVIGMRPRSSRRDDLSFPRRALGWGWSLLSPPAEFTPYRRPDQSAELRTVARASSADHGGRGVRARVAEES